MWCAKGRAIGVSAVLIAVTGASAEENEDARAVIETCLEASRDMPAARACVGIVAGPCLAASSEGETVEGVLACTETEAAAWGTILDAGYEGLVLASRAVAEIDIELGLPVGHREETLRAAQRAWIAFRDADCTSVVARFGSASQGGTAAAWCRLEHDALRAVTLRARLAEFGE